MMSYITNIEKYYQDLLILQYHNKTRAQNTVKLIADTAVGDSIYNDLTSCYDIDTAVGVQLDTIGLVIGAPRSELSDSDYRILLKFKIVWNNMDARMASMDDIIFNFFGTSISVVNNMDMSITYIIQEQFGTVLSVVQKLGFLVAPNGVGATYVTLKPLPTQIFGFNTKYDTVSAVGFSTKDENRLGTFLTKDNLL